MIYNITLYIYIYIYIIYDIHIYILLYILYIIIHYNIHNIGTIMLRAQPNSPTFRLQVSWWSRTLVPLFFVVIGHWMRVVMLRVYIYIIYIWR